jgi:uncharacterized protein YjbI with pentapeptide repeats
LEYRRGLVGTVANPVHLAKLKEGVEAWNQWRVETTLGKSDLNRVDLREANLLRANLRDANLSGADLSGAFLSGANLNRANLCEANLSGAKIRVTEIIGANFRHANLSGANLSNADLSQADLTEAKLDGANLRDANLIGAITSKVVLILGRFTQERRGILDAIREELRKRGYLPVFFDFEKPADKDNKDVEETFFGLHRTAQFVIAE